MSLEGISNKLESSRNQDYWRNVTSYYVQDFTSTHPALLLDSQVVKTHIIRQVVDGEIIKITYEQTYTFFGSNNIPDSYAVDPFNDPFDSDYIKLLRANDPTSSQIFGNLAGVTVNILSVDSPTSLPSTIPSFPPSTILPAKKVIINSGKTTTTALAVVVSLLASLVIAMISAGIWHFFIRNSTNHTGDSSDSILRDDDVAADIAPNHGDSLPVQSLFVTDHDSLTSLIDSNNDASDATGPGSNMQRDGKGPIDPPFRPDTPIRGDEGLADIPLKGAPRVTTGTGDLSHIHMLTVSEIDDLDF